MKVDKKDRKITIRVPADTGSKLEELAVIADRTLSDFIRHELEKLLKAKIPQQQNP